MTGDGSTPRGCGLLFPTPVSLAIAIFVCAIAPSFLLVLQIDANPKFSPYDEVAHLDYIERVSSGEIPRQGERLLNSTLREVSCQGYQGESFDLPPCDAKLDPGQTSIAWNQHEAQQSPTYYAATAPLRWAAHNVFGFGGDLRATRMTSVAWLVLGMTLLWTAGRLMAIAPLALGASLLVLAASPVIIYFGATVSNDVTAVPATGLVALAAALAYRRPGRWQTAGLFAAGFAAAALKTTNLLPVVAVAALFAVAALRDRGPRAKGGVTGGRWLGDAGALLLGGLLAAGIWMAVHDSIALIGAAEDPAFESLRHGPRTFGTVLTAAIALLWPLTGDPIAGDVRTFSPDTLGDDVELPFHGLLASVPLVAALSGLFVSPRRWPHVLGLIAVAVLSVGGIALAVGLLVVYDQDPVPSARYGLSLGPLLMFVLAAALAGRWAQRGFALFAAALFLTTVGAMIA